MRPCSIFKSASAVTAAWRKRAGAAWPDPAARLGPHGEPAGILQLASSGIVSQRGTPEFIPCEFTPALRESGRCRCVCLRHEGSCLFLTIRSPEGTVGRSPPRKRWERVQTKTSKPRQGRHTVLRGAEIVHDPSRC